MFERIRKVMKKPNVGSLIFGYINISLMLLINKLLLMSKDIGNNQALILVLIVLIYIINWAVFKLIIIKPDMKYFWIGNISSLSTLSVYTFNIEMLLDNPLTLEQWDALLMVLIVKITLDILISLIVSTRKRRKPKPRINTKEE